jgi:hypothetical protein
VFVCGCAAGNYLHRRVQYVSLHPRGQGPAEYLPSGLLLTQALVRRDGEDGAVRVGVVRQLCRIRAL